MAPEETIRHLIGLQAQENLPPYLSLAARLTTVDPYDVSRQLEERQLVRLLTMRGTIHLLTPEDAAVLRPWVAARIEQEVRVSQSIGDSPQRRQVEGRGSAAGRARRRSAPTEGDRAPPGRAVPPPRHPARPARPEHRAARPAAATRLLEAAGWRGLRLRRPLDRRTDGRAGRPGPGTALPAGVRAGHRSRRHCLVGGDPARACAQGHGRPRPARGRGRPAALRRRGSADRRRGRARTGPAARHLRQRVAVPRRARPGHRPRRPQVVDGHERRRRQHPVRRRLARRHLAGRRRTGSRSTGSTGDLTKAEQVRARRGGRAGRGPACAGL